jgi:hypothetical protein
MSDSHGYVPYTKGCRCAICRQGKADYMRERRAKARANAQPGGKVAGILHGSRAGYEEHGCRCSLCVETRRVYGHGGMQRPAGARQRPTPQRASRHAENSFDTGGLSCENKRSPGCVNTPGPLDPPSALSEGGPR